MPMFLFTSSQTGVDLAANILYLVGNPQAGQMGQDYPRQVEVLIGRDQRLVRPAAPVLSRPGGQGIVHMNGSTYLRLEQ